MNRTSKLQKYVLIMLLLAALRVSVCEGGTVESSLWTKLNGMKERRSHNLQGPLKWSVLPSDPLDAAVPSTVAPEIDAAITEAVTQLGHWNSQGGGLGFGYMESSLTYYHPLPSQQFYIHVVITPLQLMAVQDVHFECTVMLQLMNEQYPNSQFPSGKVTVELTNEVQIFYAINKIIPPRSQRPMSALKWSVLPSDPEDSDAPSIVKANIDAAISQALIRPDIWYRQVKGRDGRVVKLAYIFTARRYRMRFDSQGFYIQVVISTLRFPVTVVDLYSQCQAMLPLMYKDYPATQFPFGKVKIEHKKVRISYAVRKMRDLAKESQIWKRG